MKNESRLQAFIGNGIGLERKLVKLSLHNPRWKRLFSDEAHLIYDQLRLEDLRLYHCGSSSIPGIAAKPILDIVGSVASLAEFDERKSRLEEIGYECKGEYGIVGRRYSVLYDAAKETSFVHLHLFARDNPALENHLLFRDYLRALPEKARGYESMKILLAGTPRSSYSEAKGDTIQAILTAAEGWKKNPAKILAIVSSAPGGKNTADFLSEKFPKEKLEVVDLAELAISPYRYDANYPDSDEFANLVKKMIAADLVVFSTPVYWYAMSGSMKNFFDRFSNLLRGEHKPLGEALYGKKVRLLSTGSDERLPNGFEVPFSSTAIYLGMDYLGADYRAFT